MKQVLLIEGSRFRIFAVDISSDETVEDCPVMDFIAEMAEPSRNGRTIRKSLLALLRMHADHGPITNERRSRKLSENIFEFKTRQADRVYYFYNPGGQTILTHGSRKPSSSMVRNEVQREERMMAQYRKEIGA